MTTIWLLVILTYYGDGSLPLIKNLEIRAYESEEVCNRAKVNELLVNAWCQAAEIHK